MARSSFELRSNLVARARDALWEESWGYEQLGNLSEHAQISLRERVEIAWFTRDI